MEGKERRKELELINDSDIASSSTSRLLYPGEKSEERRGL